MNEFKVFDYGKAEHPNDATLGSSPDTYLKRWEKSAAALQNDPNGSRSKEYQRMVTKFQTELQDAIKKRGPK